MKLTSILCLLVLALAARAGETMITLPAETAAFKPGRGAELAQANCLICHSADYISMQPPMPRAFWEGTLKKMKEKFGAPTPDETLVALAEYLTATYGVPDKKP